jgi:ABC-type nitrate/sulfonate/bicarbonate transport system substrate-binding protein
MKRRRHTMNMKITNRISVLTSASLLALTLRCEIALGQEKSELNTVIEGISSPDFGYVTSYLARAKGFFKNEGLDLKIVIMRSNVSVPALVTGEVQLAVHGSAMTAALKGAPLKAVFFTYNTSTLQFMVRGDIQKPEDLKGKVVAIASPGGSQDQATRLILKKLGLDPARDVKLLAVGSAKARVIGMETGQIAASANNLDIAAELVKKGYHIMANSSEVYPVPWAGFAANDRWLRTNPALAKKWLRGQVKALLFIREHPDEAAQIAAQELNLNYDVAREAIGEASDFITPKDPGGFTENGMRSLIRYTAERVGIDPQKVKITDVADVTLLRGVQQELGIQCRGGYLCPP